MKFVTITRAEVKTVYHISIPRKSVRDIVERLRKSPLSDIYWKTKLLRLDAIDSLTDDNLANAFFNIWNVSQGREETETIGLIVRDALGFSGVENYGYYSIDTDSIEMSVYNYGDTMN